MTARLTLFGAMLATADGETLPIRGEIPRAIVARLALSTGEFLTAEQLIADLWVAPPDTVLSSLRAHISRLRSSGWGELLTGGRQGYRLELGPDDVDVLQYRRLVGDRSLPRYEALVDAERLWRGEPLAALLDFPFARPFVASLSELRRAGALELARLRLERGEHAIVALALADVVAQHPFDEESLRLHAQALARSGRTSDALDAIDAFRARLVDERGVEPTEALAELRRGVVRQDPAIVTAALEDAPPVARSGIPIPLTRFVGRDAELELVERGRTESRLVTLVGPAGVGKTRLAIEAARRATSAVDDEQWLVDLAAVPEPARVVSAIADTVGAPDHSLSGVAELLTGRRSLLIVDNAEHVLGTVASAVSHLLASCEGLTVVVTSRESLRMAGERIIHVDPFTGSSAPDAVRLFLERAVDASGAATFTEEQERIAARLCAALDGLPLALELAAARLDVLSLEELADSVRAGQLQASDGGRHASIDSAIGWSIDLLSQPELDALDQLAQFPGSFGLDAIVGICVVPGHDPRELTVALARKSLVAPIASDTGARRFRLLDSVRAHMLARSAVDADAWRDRHLQWMLGFAQRQSERLRSREARDARALLNATRPDMDAALERAFGSGDRRLVMEFIGALAWYWYERGFKVDGRATIERGLAMPGERTPDLDAWALRAVAFMASTDADPLDVVRLTSRYWDAAAEAEEPGIRMFGASMWAYIHAVQGDVDEADRYLELGARIRAEGTPPAWLAADDLVLRGDALRSLKRPTQALEALAEAYRTGNELGHMFPVKGACYATGKTFIDIKRGADAIPALRTGALRSLETEDLPSMLAATAMLAAACGQIDELDDAALLFGAVDANGARHGYSLVGADVRYGEVHRERVRAAMTAEEWDAAYSRGTELTLQALMRHIMTLG